VLGSQAPISFTPAAISQVFGSSAARGDLRGAPDFRPRTTAEWTSIIRSSVWLTNNQVNAYTGTGPLITDDHPLTEYFLLDGASEGTEELAALRLSLVVAGLLGLLIIGAIADSASRRRSRAG
jgi:hypothetical protein